MLILRIAAINLIEFQLSLASGLFYYSTTLEDVSFLNEESQEIEAVRSSTECILKCKRRFTQEAFYSNDGQCFCIGGMDSINGGSDETTGNNYSGEIFLKVKVFTTFTHERFRGLSHFD